MILIGQYDSPFVRRVGLALTFYGLPFEHRPWSVFGDGEKIRPLNPLVRVPTLVLDDGEVLVDSHSMIDHLDHRVGPDRALYPHTEPARTRAVKVAALALGAAEKGVSLFYEHRLHQHVSQVWSDRCRSQMIGALGALEAGASKLAGRHWFGDHIGHADIAVGVATRFLREAHPSVVDQAAFPALLRYAGSLEALAEFRAVSQPFIPPA